MVDSKLNGEERAEMELRYNHNHDEKGRFCSGRGGGRFSSGKSVDKSEKGDIIKENGKKSITPITDSSLNNIPNVSIDGYTSEQCTEIQKQHKELLDYSRKNNDNKEIAFVFDSELKNRKEFKGEDDILDFGSALYGKDLLVMHNHPRNSSYSTTDLVFFNSHSNIKTLTIVKNNGNVEYITKGHSFDGQKFALEYNRFYTKMVKTGSDAEKNKFVKALLSKTKSGVIWSEKG